MRLRWLKNENNSKRVFVIPRVTHTHLPIREAELAYCACVRAARTKKMKTRERGRDGTKMHVAAMKGKPNAQEQKMNPTSLSEPGRPETWI